ncbi:hypothetical protein LV779_32640 [Streptomyces thinghirensis]|nr:hypothetical protein [Streptomyces thinghirensis]
MTPGSNIPLSAARVTVDVAAPVAARRIRAWLPSQPTADALRRRLHLLQPAHRPGRDLPLRRRRRRTWCDGRHLRRPAGHREDRRHRPARRRRAVLPGHRTDRHRIRNADDNSVLATFTPPRSSAPRPRW